MARVPRDLDQAADFVLCELGLQASERRWRRYTIGGRDRIPELVSRDRQGTNAQIFGSSDGRCFIVLEAHGTRPGESESVAHQETHVHEYFLDDQKGTWVGGHKPAIWGEDYEPPRFFESEFADRGRGEVVDYSQETEEEFRERQAREAREKWGF